MAKMRVYELAKELNIASKDVVNFFEKKGMKVVSQSGIDEEQISLAQREFSSQKTNASQSKDSVESSSNKEDKVQKQKTEEDNSQNHQKKKSTITAVFNAQYSNQNGQPKSRKDDNHKGTSGNNANRNSRSNENNNRRESRNENAHTIIRPRPAGERPIRPKGNVSPSTLNHVANESTSVEKQEINQVETTDNKPKKTFKPEQSVVSPIKRENVYENRKNVTTSNQTSTSRTSSAHSDNAHRNDSQRRYDGNRRPNNGAGVRPGNGSGARPNNGAGARPNNGFSPRPNNGSGARPNNGSGARPGNGMGNRSTNNYQNRNDGPNRSYGNRDNRGNQGNQGNRPPYDKKRSSETMPVDEARQKESREKNDFKNNHKKTQEHDVLGSKKQERYVNLEKNGGKKRNKAPQPKVIERPADEILTISLPEHLSIRELSEAMKIKSSDIIKMLFLKGTMVTVNSDVSYEEAEEIALEYNCICEPKVKVDVIAELLKEEEEDTTDMISRPPVVCVLGHVDHGKTSLLDAIRDTRVTDREAGGITQKIGAYVVSINNQKITFLDTPGHEAFTAMRMRGANATDIAILVVAADDGVMPQTIEAINHAKAAGIEIIVAVNKIDKPNANIERVKQELSEYELIPEDWGGSTIFVPVSAHTHEGIDTLLEMILLTSDVLELKANPKRNARGLVIEAELDKGRGTVATVLVQKGTLHVGDKIAVGSYTGKVRAMIDDKGRRLKKAGPSTPVAILGLSDVPNAGDIFLAFDSEKEAHIFADTFISEGKNRLIEDTKSKMSLDDLFTQIQAGNLKELNIIIKADVQGSVEAVKQSLEKLSNDEVVVKIIHGGVGAINESDIVLASASNAIIIGFNVRPDAVAKQTADREGVSVRLYKVIYNAIEDVEAAMKGMLEPIFEEKVIGHAEIRQIFKSSDIGNIAGSYILDGYFQRDCKVRITREDEMVFEGALGSLKRFKDDVKEVKAGYECGLVFEGFYDFKEEDKIEAYTMVEVPR